MSSTVSGAGGASAPSSGVASTNSNEALEGFVLLCKSSSGVQCVMVLKQVLKHPQIFVFGELLQLASIQQLSQSESASDRAWFSLLQLFAHGTWMDYQRQAKAQGLPELGPAEATKLKQLTIVDMAAKQRVSDQHHTRARPKRKGTSAQAPDQRREQLGRRPGGSRC